MLLGIDKFMSECRALTNLIGNGVASVVISRWEGELDVDKLHEAMAQSDRARRGDGDQPGLGGGRDALLLRSSLFFVPLVRANRRSMVPDHTRREAGGPLRRYAVRRCTKAGQKPGLRFGDGSLPSYTITCGGMLRKACIMWKAMARFLALVMLWATFGRIDELPIAIGELVVEIQKVLVGGDAVVVAAQHQHRALDLQGIDQRQLGGHVEIGAGRHLVTEFQLDIGERFARPPGRRLRAGRRA